MIDTVQLRRSLEYSDFWVGQEEPVELQALQIVAGVVTGRDLSGVGWEMHLRFYDAQDTGTPTLIFDKTMTRLADPDEGGAAGATGIASTPVRFDEAHDLVLVYFVAVDVNTIVAGTPSGKRELRLSRPWVLEVHGVPAPA